MNNLLVSWINRPVPQCLKQISVRMYSQLKTGTIKQDRLRAWVIHFRGWELCIDLIEVISVRRQRVGVSIDWDCCYSVSRGASHEGPIITLLAPLAIVAFTLPASMQVNNSWPLHFSSFPLLKFTSDFCFQGKLWSPL